MKIVILAGGLGTRLAEETEVRPKPMVEIGGRPILWHIMKHFAAHGFKEFIVALGYKGEVVKRWFLDSLSLSGNLTLDLRAGIQRHERICEDEWVVHLCDTGADTNTGGRLRRLRGMLADGPCIVTYGDGLSDVDLPALVAFHKAQRRHATVTAVRPPARYGGICFEGDLVAQFTEKPQAGEGWINGGYLVLEPAALECIASDDTSLEAEVLEQLARQRQLAAYRHDGFWQCMDTLRDKRQLEALWQRGHAPWKVR